MVNFNKPGYSIQIQSAYKSIQISNPFKTQTRPFKTELFFWAPILYGIQTFKVDFSLVGSFLTFPSVCSSTNWLLAFQSRAWYIFSEGIKSWKCYQKLTNLGQNHSMARANLNKSVWLVTNTTTASKYIPRRTRISINWNPPFQTSLHKIFKNCFLWSKSCFTMFALRGTFTK